MAQTALFSGATADGNSTAYSCLPSRNKEGYLILLTGGFGGGTVTVQASVDSGSNYYTLRLTATTAGFLIIPPLPEDVGKIRLNLAGATAATLTGKIIDNVRSTTVSDS